MKQLNLLRELLSDLYYFCPKRFFITFGLMFLRSLTAGVGLLLILPLLQLIGLSQEASTTGYLMGSVAWFFHMTHLPMNLESMLFVYIFIICCLASIVYFEQTIGGALQQAYTRHLRAHLHQTLFSTPWPFLLKQKLSDLLYALTTQIQGVALCHHQLLALINQILLIGVYTGVACFLSFKLTMLAIVSALFLLVLLRPLHQRTSRAGSRHLKQNQSMLQALNEQFSAIKIIKGSGLETRFMEHLVTVNASLADENERVIRMTAKSKLLYTCSAVIFFSGLLYTALVLLHLPLGRLLLLLIVFSRLLPLVSSGQQMYQRILHQLPAYLGVQALLKAAHQAILPRCTQKNLNFISGITFKNVGFAYSGTKSTRVIEALSFHLEKNTTLALIGPSGVGKSTVADLMVGLLAPTEGEIWIDNERLTPASSALWRKDVAYVTQDVFLFHASIRDNLTWFGSAESDTVLWDALETAAADFVRDLKAGLDTVIGDRGVRLSGGERQRIALARAILMRPKLLILDESTNALDTENVQKIQKALRALHGKMTLVIISHQADMYTFATEQIRLEKVEQKDIHEAKRKQTSYVDAHQATIL